MSTVVGQKTLERGLRATFIKAYAGAEDPSEIMPFILETNSDGRDEEYGWLGQSPSMQEWVDERQLKSLNDFDYSLTNKDYEATLSVNKNDLEDDRLGNVKIRIQDLAVRAKQHPRKLFFDALIAGTTALCYDGLAFFSASHTEGDSGTQSNLLTGTGITLALLKADMIAAEAAMRGYLDDTGEPMDETPPKLGVVCPLGMTSLFEELNTSVQISNSSNTMKGKLSAIVSSGRLTDGNDWYLVNMNEGIKPFIRQVRQKAEFSALEGESDNGFMRKNFAYGVDSREVFGYGLWQKCVKTTNT